MNENNYYFKLFQNILESIYSYFHSSPKLITCQMHFLLAKTFQKLIKLIYKYYKPYSMNNKDKIGVDNVVNDNEDVVLADNHKDENETKKKEGVWKFESVNNDWEGCNFIDDYGEEHFVPYGEILNVKIIATSKVNEEGNSFGEFPLVKLELVKDEDSGGNKKITVKMIEEGGYAYFDSKSSCLYRPFNRSKIYS